MTGTGDDASAGPKPALCQAAAGVDPGLGITPAGAGARPFLDLAVRCAEWIDRSQRAGDPGIAWPADPGKPASLSLALYHGTPGVVSFFARLFQATGEPAWREAAEHGGRYLAATSARQGSRLASGLYTGLAGLAATYMVLDASGIGPSWRGIARQAASALVARARARGDALEWSDSNDVVSGTAGIGLFLLQAASVWGDEELLDVAKRAGRRLLETAQSEQGGLAWTPSASVARHYPNFSHGTAGVAYFLATLYQQTGEVEYLEAALAGARYLDAIATRRQGARAVFYATGGGEDLFYLGWCHGPVGTARLFYRLLQATGDPGWREWIDELTAWVVSSGAPEQTSAGYWDNISQCCGSVGIGQYCIDLARYYPIPMAEPLLARVVAHTLARATDDEGGLRWVQAEGRRLPGNRLAQTGLMQGAAGVGTFFLQLDAFTRGREWSAPMPDTPWSRIPLGNREARRA